MNKEEAIKQQLNDLINFISSHRLECGFKFMVLKPGMTSEDVLKEAKKPTMEVNLKGGGHFSALKNDPEDIVFLENTATPFLQLIVGNLVKIKDSI